MRIYYIFQKSKLVLPSSVFESEYEEDIGLLDRAVPRSGPLVGLDPDVLEVMETLDDAYEVEEVVHGKDLADVFGQEDGDDEEEEVEVEEGDLEDILADIVKGEEEARNEEQEGEGEEYYDSDSDRFPFGGDDDDGFETKSKFTEYSMSSAVVPRSEQLVILDDKFEKVLMYIQTDFFIRISC